MKTTATKRAVKINEEKIPERYKGIMGASDDLLRSISAYDMDFDTDVTGYVYHIDRFTYLAEMLGDEDSGEAKYFVCKKLDVILERLTREVYKQAKFQTQ